MEQLAPEAVEQLRLGLLSVSLARQLVRLPMGNQQEALRSATQASLTSVELRGVVDLLLSSSTEEQRRLVLDEPRRALRQASDTYAHQWDARLSVAGNRAARRLGQLLESLASMDAWLRHRGRSELAACDRQPLTDGFQRLVVDSRHVAEAAADFLAEQHLPPRSQRVKTEWLRERFAQWGETGSRFLEGLLAKQRYARSPAEAVLALERYSRRQDLLAALERAVRDHAYSFKALERILTCPGFAAARLETPLR